MMSGITATTMSITWSGEAVNVTRRRARHSEPARDLDAAMGRTAQGRPPGAVGVQTLWAMYLVLFVGSGLQWLLQV